MAIGAFKKKIVCKKTTCRLVLTTTTGSRQSWQTSLYHYIEPRSMLNLQAQTLEQQERLYKNQIRLNIREILQGELNL
jgi:hypothetical protein